MVAPPMSLEGATAAAPRSRTVAAPVVAFGGALIALGSISAWRVCPHSGCDAQGGFLVITWVSGIGLGTGILTELAGLVLVWLGIDAARRRSRTPFRSESLVLAAAAALIAIAALVAYFRPEWDYLGWGLGFGPIIVIAGGVGAVAAAVRLEPVRSRPIHRARLAAVVAVIGAGMLWQRGLGSIPWHTGSDPGPSAHALATVLFALAIVTWPAHRPNRRVVAGQTTILLVGAAYAAIMAGLAPSWLLILAWLPILLHFALGWSTAPEPTPQTAGPTSSLLAAAVVVGGVVASVALRLTGILGPLPRSGFDVPERPDEWLLLSGLAILVPVIARIASERARRGRPE